MKKNVLITLIILCGLTANAQVFDVDTISITGDIEDRINIVFLSDGYQADELDKFIEDAHWMEDALLGRSPYREYRAYFNSFAIKVPSNVSGAADDPGELIDNYFGSTFNTAGIWRLVTPRRSGKIHSVLADNFPRYDQVVLIVNDSRYGGSGGWAATSTTNPDGPEICIHEIGHSFAGLSDEYWAGSQYARENINMTRETDRSEVRWKNWLDFRSVGIYQHAESPEWKRPHQNCEMRYLNRQFCPICQEAIANKILDMTNPIISFYPDEDGFVHDEPEIEFSVNLLRPAPNTLKTVWVLNGDSIAGNIDTLRFSSADLFAGSNQMQAYILDTTKYIRSPDHRSLHMYIRNWEFESGSSGINLEKFNKNNLNLEIFPNPASDYVNISGILAEPAHLELYLMSPQGKKIRIIKNKHYPEGELQTQIDLLSMKIPGGIYFIIVSVDGLIDEIPLIIK